ESVAEDDFALFQRSSLRPHLDRLAGLDGLKRDLLVHLGSPPVAAVRPVAPPTPSDIGALGSWVEIPGGTFQMGSPDFEDAKPVHTARLSSFEVSRYPVTNAEYARYVSEHEVRPPSHWTDGKIPDGLDRHPVVNVSWDSARDYCTWLTTTREGTATLPTEAQWEYAAAGSRGGRYPWGDANPTDKHANFENSVGATTPVGSYPKGATPEGVHDLADNVWEWCSDWHGSYDAAEQTDPRGPQTGNGRVLRGGAFRSDPDALRCAYRVGNLPEYAYYGIGFRCVVVASGGQDERQSFVQRTQPLGLRIDVRNVAEAIELLEGPASH
ncbi:MAG: formylglycine-generating enzyme family protein, partial [Acidobacteria bacterium]|nr:formylglycine-generating enzyme family protein [Acidobacteriota bacterium]